MKRFAVILGLNVAMLLVVGLVAHHSASNSDLEPERLQAHLWHIGIGLAMGGLAACLNYSRLRQGYLPYLLLGLALLGLLGVFFPFFGEEINGARRWTRWGGQPSAFAQIAMIVALAHYTATHQTSMSERNRGFLCPGLWAGAVVVLIFLEPDWGTAILVAGVAGVMLFVAGTHWAYLITSAIMAGELFAICLCFNPAKLQRLLCFMDPEAFQDGLGWQGWTSVLSLGVGGWLGHPGGGLLKYQYVPEQETDFILSRVGEEFGFVGTLLVLLNFVSLTGAGLYLAGRTRDTFGQMLALGLTFLIGFQAFINIGVVTSSLPNKGIVLPFLSQGGSSMVALLTCAGLLASVALHGPHEDGPTDPSRHRPDCESAGQPLKSFPNHP